MPVVSNDRGWEIYWDEERELWIYEDTQQPVRLDRPCANCGNSPTPEGYDHCLGNIKGAESACCGHGGVTERFVIMRRKCCACRID